MALSTLSNSPVSSIKKYIDNKKVVILYPNTLYKSQLTAYFTREIEGTVFYHQLSRPNIPLQDWIIESSREFNLIDNDYDADKVIEGAQGSKNPSDWANSIVKAFKKLKNSKNVIFFDDFDLTPPTKELATFLGTLLDNLPSNCIAVFSSRLLAYYPWVEFVTKSQGIILGTGFRKSSIVLTPSEGSNPQLEVSAFGTGSAYVNGVEMTHWDGSLPRFLFFYLVDNPLVTRDQIFTMFWPSLGTKEATNVFHVTKRKIGERLTEIVGDGNDYELTSYGAGFYSPSKNVVRHYDVGEFIDAVTEAHETEDEQHQVELLQRAISLYKGDFLSTLDATWANERREYLKSLYVKALVTMGRIHLKHQLHDEALNYFKTALKYVPQREEIHRDVMQVYAESGRTQEAVLQYRTLAERLKQDLDLPPSKETRALYEKIMADY